ncbi:hypothetical protein Hypma_003056 [Hypsizygus marmoreus]|uniref:Cytochrome P450 n=1 Tax=Hypsizygus marmoreus TaxID=39966 RepID=A0A369J2U1_HYPMA|nr:hypothetical protein Hypma_003056 [Hypsizygus marmoreus]
MSPFAVATLVCALSIVWAVRKAITITKCIQKNLTGPPRTSWITGNILQLNEPNGLDFHSHLLQYGGVAKIHGLFGDEQIYFSDPLALRHILITEEHLFPETPTFTALNKLTFGDAMSTVHGPQHKKQRKLLNPIFAPVHMRGLVPVISDLANEVAHILERDVHGGKSDIDMLDLLWRAAIETIGRVGLGCSFGDLDKEKNVSNPYSDSVKHYFPNVVKLGPLLIFLPALSRVGSPSFRRRIVELIPSTTIQTVKRLIDTMDQGSHDVLSKRKAALASGEEDVLSEKVGKGRDIIKLLLTANESVSEDDRLSEEEVIGQINLFLFASSVTTSGALARTLEKLARNPDVQERLRKELVEAQLDHGPISYDALTGLKYLHAVLKETLRLYPPVITMERTASQDVTVPLHMPVKGVDGQMISQIHVAKNQTVIIGVANCNTDPRIWGSDALMWKPDRWLEPLPESLLTAHVPGVLSNTMSFLCGPRACIGYNMALMEMKLILLALIPKFHFALSDDMVEWKLGFTQYPTVFGKGSQLPLKLSLFPVD